MKRIGILGGTFNPIHNGHLSIADKAREQFALEKVLFMPSGVPYMKEQQEILSFDIRCEMTALAIADDPYFELCTLEASDAAQGKNTYTFKTLQKLRRADPDADYYFILGADNLYGIEHWKNPSLIFENCTLLAAVRAEETSNGLPQTVSCMNSMPVKTTEDPRKRLAAQALFLREKYGASIKKLEFSGIDVSSTQIREMVRRGESICGLVPKTVETYILKKQFYVRKEPFQ